MCAFSFGRVASHRGLAGGAAWILVGFLGLLTACRESVPDRRPQWVPVPASFEQIDTTRYQSVLLSEGVSFPSRWTSRISRVLVDAKTFSSPKAGQPSLGAVKIAWTRETRTPGGLSFVSGECLASENGTPLVVTRLGGGPEGAWFLEMRNTGRGVRLRSSRSECNLEKNLEGSWFFAEQVPFLVRAALARKPLNLRVLRWKATGGPQLATETLEAAGFETLVASGGSNRVLRIILQGGRRGADAGETWWLDPQSGRTWKAEREVPEAPGGEMAHETLEATGSWILRQDDPLPPENPASTAEAADASHSALLALNLMKVRQDRGGKSFSLTEWLRLEGRPREWISAPQGSDRVVTNRDGAGGWFYDDKASLDGKPGRFYLNAGPARASD